MIMLNEKRKMEAFASPGASKSTQIARGIAVFARGNRLGLCAIGVDRRMYWAVCLVGKWSKMSPADKMPVTGTPTLVFNGSTSSLNLFAVDLDSQLAFNVLPANNSSWTGWKIVFGSWIQTETTPSVIWP
jgi:hypothetical protein